MSDNYQLPITTSERLLPFVCAVEWGQTFSHDGRRWTPWFRWIVVAQFTSFGENSDDRIEGLPTGRCDLVGWKNEHVGAVCWSTQLERIRDWNVQYRICPIVTRSRWWINRFVNTARFIRRIVSFGKCGNRLFANQLQMIIIWCFFARAAMWEHQQLGVRMETQVGLDACLANVFG